MRQPRPPHFPQVHPHHAKDKVRSQPCERLVLDVYAVLLEYGNRRINSYYVVHFIVVFFLPLRRPSAAIIVEK